MRGDVKPAQNLVDPNVVTHGMRHGPAPGDAKGLDTFLARGAKLSELSGGSFTEELLEVVADDQTAFQLGVFRATRKGRSIEDHRVNV